MCNNAVKFYYSTTTALHGGGSKKVNRTSRCAHMTLVGLRAAGDQLRLAREFAVLGDYDTSRVYYQGVLSQVSRYVWGAEAHAHARRPLAPLTRMDDLRFQIYLASHCRVRHVAVLPPPPLTPHRTPDADTSTPWTETKTQLIRTVRYAREHALPADDAFSFSNPTTHLFSVGIKTLLYCPNLAALAQGTAPPVRNCLTRVASPRLPYYLRSTGQVAPRARYARGRAPFRVRANAGAVNLLDQAWKRRGGGTREGRRRDRDRRGKKRERFLGFRRRWRREQTRLRRAARRRRHCPGKRTRFRHCRRGG